MCHFSLRLLFFYDEKRFTDRRVGKEEKYKRVWRIQATAKKKKKEKQKIFFVRR